MGQFNILVIDDELKNQDTNLFKLKFEAISEEKGAKHTFDCVLKKTREEGKEYIDNNRFVDLIILDLLFESDSGQEKSFELLKYVKENYPKIPILLLSSTKNYEDLKTAGFEADYRPDDFISKDETINKGGDKGVFVPNFEKLYDSVLGLLFKFGKIPVENGVLITHGTDTMPWAFAILRYGLHKVKTNIIITGSQLPLEGTFSPSDAIGNMLTSVKLLNLIEPPNIIQVFNDGIHIFNKNLIKVKKWSFDAFSGNSFAKIEDEELKVFEKDISILSKENRLDKLYFIKTGGTIDSVSKEEGLVAEGDFTGKYLKKLGQEYFNKIIPKEINPKDSSLFNPIDWKEMLITIKSWKLAECDTNFDWNVLPIFSSPFMDHEYYASLFDKLIDIYSGAIVLGYGAGNINIFSSQKTPKTMEYSQSFGNEFGALSFDQQRSYSLIPFLENVEKYNKKNPKNYKFIIMSSQVPLDTYDIDYQAGQIPLYYGLLPSGELSYPEAQTKLAYILGHKKMIIEKASEFNLTYEQLVKSCFMSGIRFRKNSNRMKFLEISKKEYGCEIKYHKNNLFVKHSFEDALEEIVKLYLR